jgi:4-hydroxy-tetrahydrodipicolinate synthase
MDAHWRVRFRGIVPAMLTPFTADFALDEAAVSSHIEDYLAAGVHGISVAGSQGEFFALDFSERVRLVETAVKAVNGRVPVYAGTGAVTTREAVTLTQAAEGAGADAAMVITPYVIAPSPDELFAHYAAIARATRLPILVDNDPARTGGVNIAPALFARLAHIDNIVGISDSSGDIAQMSDYLRLTGYRRAAFAGGDALILSALIHGAAGAISPAASVFPGLVVGLYEAVVGRRPEEARRISDRLAPLRAAWGWGSFPAAIKEAMALAGRDAGPARPPVSGLCPERRSELKAIVEALKSEEMRDE